MALPNASFIGFKWAALEALEVDPKRIALVAADLVAHFEKRLEAMDGKAMIVCMSRRICVDMYDALIVLRPDWASARDDNAEAETVSAVDTMLLERRRPMSTSTAGMLISTEAPALCAGVRPGGQGLSLTERTAQVDGRQESVIFIRSLSCSPFTNHSSAHCLHRLSNRRSGISLRPIR